MVVDHRHLRGKDIVDRTPNMPYVDSTTNPADQIEAKRGNSGDALAITLCIVFFAPCFLSCILQAIFRWKRRQQLRVEREILEVTTNPNSRRIVLDEILKGSSKVVEFPSNKRRVQVKKHRKKLPEERRRLGRSNDEENDVVSDNEVPTNEFAHDFEEEMGSVRGRMIICISSNKSEEKYTSDDASASSMGSCESQDGVDDCDSCKSPNLIEEDDTDHDVDYQGSVKRISPNCLRESLDIEEPCSFVKLSIPNVDGVDGNGWNASTLYPKPNPRDEANDGEIFRTFSNDLSQHVSDNLAMTLLLCQEVETDNTPFDLVLPLISDDEDSIEDEKKPIRQPTVFRSETQGKAKIELSSSTLTEVTSNVVDTCVKTDDVLPSSERLQNSSDLSRGSDSESRLNDTIPLKNVASSKSSKTDTSSKADTSSHVSYFSYDDETIASDQADMCAICICPYDEGDIRIFSKRCPHSFHKDCLFEWLVKGHDECPCCRIDMVSKSEVKETSASLIGTERLAQALASTMVEAPPLRFRQALMARQMFARARQSRRRSGPDENEAAESSARINSHWLWSARFDLPSPASAEQRSSLPPVSETFPQPAGVGQSTTATTRTEVTPSAPLQTRSFDAIMDHQPTEDLATRSFDAITDPQTSQVQSASRHAAANTRNFHNHWASWNNAQLMRTPRRSNSTHTSFPVATSPLDRLRRSGNISSPETLAVTVLPAI